MEEAVGSNYFTITENYSGKKEKRPGSRQERKKKRQSIQVKKGLLFPMTTYARVAIVEGIKVLVVLLVLIA